MKRFFLIAVAACLIFASPLAGPLNGQESSDSDDFEILFDGSSLDKWQGYKQEAIGKGWKIEESVLVYDGTGGGDIVTRESYDNFELHLDWKVTKGANSGIMFHVGMGDGAPYLTGPEFQILDDAQHGDGKNELTSAGALYGLYKAEGKELKKTGEWNTSKIIVNGNHIEHWLNGKKVVEAEKGSDTWKERIAASKFKSWKKFATLTTGRICLQDHGDKVAFQNIKIKRIKSEK